MAQLSMRLAGDRKITKISLVVSDRDCFEQLLKDYGFAEEWL